MGFAKWGVKRGVVESFERVPLGENALRCYCVGICDGSRRCVLLINYWGRYALSCWWVVVWGERKMEAVFLVGRGVFGQVGCGDRPTTEAGTAEFWDEVERAGKECHALADKQAVAAAARRQAISAVVAAGYIQLRLSKPQMDTLPPASWLLASKRQSDVEMG